MKNIAIMMGGTSKEKEISLKSGKTIYQNIDITKYNAYKVLCIDMNCFEVLIDQISLPIDTYDFSFKLNNTKVKFDKVFMMIHGDPGENGKLCSYFDSLKIPYTSCDGPTSLLTFNKFKCNKILKELGYIVPKSNLYTINLEIKFPCIIKPTCSGSSFGISKVSCKNYIDKALKDAFYHDKEVMVEEFIEGRELTCAVYISNQEIKTLPITEIISENEIFDFDAKYNGKSTEETPAKLSQYLKNKIQNTSKNIYKDLHLSGIIRIDYILQNDILYIIEINTIPGFSKKSIVPQMLECANINLSSFISSQLENI